MYGLLVNTADKVLPSLITKSAIYNHPAGTIKNSKKLSEFEIDFQEREIFF